MAGWKASRPRRSGIRGMKGKKSGGGGPAGAATPMVYMDGGGAAGWIKEYLYFGLHDNGLNK